jgi:nicotinamide-nucleotide amidase
MNAAIIAIGSEMLGTTRVDTNSLKITAALEQFGVELVRKSVVGDRLGDLSREIVYALERADVVIITGGLGPTEDDLTREALADALGLTMEVDQSIIDKLVQRFAARGTPMPEVNNRQANVFVGQETLFNERGTAPGFHLRPAGKHIFVFPGVPHELEWMLATYFVPWLRQVSPGSMRRKRVLKISGLTESGVEEKLKPFYLAHEGEPLTILASPSGIELHLIADGAEEAALAEIALREAELAEIFAHRIFGYDDDTMESVVGQLLAERGATVSTAESCTGGLLSARLTDVPGSSRYFMGGAIVYTAAAKTDLAGVDPALIREHGEVSEPVAIALAQGVRERFNTTYGIGITGIAGPGGGSEAKPVGTVHIAVANATKHEHRRMFWPSTRPIIRALSTQAALDLLRLFMLRAV